MKEFGKVRAVLKYKPEDFIVEEVGEKWIAAISSEFPAGKTPDFSKLDLEDRRDFLWFEMEKKNIDHFSALKELSVYLTENFNSIGAAGIKDKVAWTSQRISTFRPDIEKLKLFSHPNIYIKNFKWGKRKIKIGFLIGNNFRITLRDLDKKDASLAANKIRSKDWFPNYFGGQRFGIRNNNARIGKLILKRKFEDAVWEILTGVGDERDDVIEARLKLRKSRDLVNAAQTFPSHLRLETRIIDYLVRNPGDYLGAIKRIDRRIGLIYVNAIQSKLFNEILEIALDENIDFKSGRQKSVLLFGYKSRFSEGRLGDIEREVLKNNGIELEDFDVKEIGYMRMKGSMRKAVTLVNDLVVDVEDDEEFEFSKKIVLSFNLSSGTYATTFLENFFDLEEQKK